METLADLVARERRDDQPALATPGRTADYRRLCTTAWKTANFLRHRGVRTGTTMGVVTPSAGAVDPVEAGDPRLRTAAGVPAPQAVYALLGAVSIGGVVRVDPPPGTVDARAVVAPTPALDRYEPAGGQRVGYGPEPEAPGVDHWGTAVWSENPTVPPERPAADAPALSTGEATRTHAELLAAARAVRDRHGVGPDDRIALHTPLADPRAVVAGVVAPLLVGGTIRLPDATDETPDADRLVGGEAADSRTLRLDAVEL
jgi:acyl-CoA synthetase (AMP-forming)/AMP-acid ligase II